MPRFFAATLALFLATGAGAAAVSPRAIPETVSVKELQARIATLADDKFQGRQPGTRGGLRTEAYVAKAFARAKLAPGAAGGGWRQTITLVRRTPVTAAFRLGPVGIGADQLALTGRGGSEGLDGAPVFFVGAALPEQIADTDLHGAIVLLASELPGGGHGLGDREEALRAAGAAAILIIPAADADWPAFAAEQGGRARLPDFGARIEGAIARPAAARLAQFTGQSFDALLTAAGGAGFRPLRLPGGATLSAETRVAPFQTANIVGKVAGSDPAAGAVVLSAHWDHLGAQCRPEGAPDRICNGAVDNASGTAMLIEIARRVAAGPRPRRDVYFLATTSEELGLLGARAFADAPPVPLGRVVANLNIDTAAIAPAGMPVAIMGRGRTPALDTAIDAAIRKAGRQLDSDNEADIMLKRQDGWAFGEKGVPAVMVSGSFSDMNKLMAYLRANYHGPLDDVAHLPPLDGAAEDATLHVALARALADPALYPSPRR
nr:M28 family peptidase [Sphingomonas quercus]